MKARLWLLMVAMAFPVLDAPAAMSEAHRTLPVPVLRARWTEDWSTVGDMAPIDETVPSASGDFWLPMKNIPLNESGTSYLSFGGELRLHYERYDEADMGISDVGLQDALQLRAAFHADWHINPRWRIFSSLGYADVSDREGGAKTADRTDPDIWQMFVDHRLPVGAGERVILRLGRQLIETANLFINAGEGNSVRQVYNGVRVARVGDDFAPFDAFAAEYVDFADGAFDMSGTGEYFWGGRAGMQRQEPGLDLHLLYTGWNLKDRQFEQGGGNRHDELRHTLLFWLNRPLLGQRQWGLDYYLAYQFGQYDDRPGGSDINAYAAFGELKYAWHAQPRTPLVGLKTGYFSGDRNPDDNELNTFYNHVFATPYFGYARDIQPFNLIHIQPNIGYRFGDRGLVSLTHGFLWRAEENDAYYGKPNAITARASVSDSRWLGQQTELGIRYRPTANLILSSYLSRFFAGTVIKDAGGSVRDYIHFGVHYLF